VFIATEGYVDDLSVPGAPSLYEFTEGGALVFNY